MIKSMTEYLPFILLLAWMAVIFTFSNQANSNAATEEYFGSLNYIVRKTAHVLEYTILCGLAYWSYRKVQTLRSAASEALSQKQKAPVAFACLLPPFLFTVLYAISDEWHQSFVPGRSAEVSDVLIDSSGALLFCVFLLLSRLIGSLASGRRS